MAARSDGSGYWLVASDGGIFAYNVPFFGSLPGSKVNEEATAMRPTFDGNGYMIVKRRAASTAMATPPTSAACPRPSPATRAGSRAWPSSRCPVETQRYNPPPYGAGC